MATDLDFLFHYHEAGEDFLNRTITGDEKWFHHFTPEMKSASQQWVGKGDECPVKAKCERSAGKVHLTAFWDNEGILLEEYAPKGVTITRKLYFDTLMRLREAIKKKHPGKLLRKVFLIHDNATWVMTDIAANARWQFWNRVGWWLKWLSESVLKTIRLVQVACYYIIHVTRGCFWGAVRTNSFK